MIGKLNLYCAIIGSMLIISCGRYIKTYDIKKANKLCEGNGGLHYMQVFKNTYSAECENGARFLFIDKSK